MFVQIETNGEALSHFFQTILFEETDVVWTDEDSQKVHNTDKAYLQVSAPSRWIHRDDWNLCYSSDGEPLPDAEDTFHLRTGNVRDVVRDVIQFMQEFESKAESLPKIDGHQVEIDRENELVKVGCKRVPFAVLSEMQELLEIEASSEAYSWARRARERGATAEDIEQVIEAIENGESADESQPEIRAGELAWIPTTEYWKHEFYGEIFRDGLVLIQIVNDGTNAFAQLSHRGEVNSLDAGVEIVPVEDSRECDTSTLSEGQVQIVAARPNSTNNGHSHVPVDSLRKAEWVSAEKTDVEVGDIVRGDCDRSYDGEIGEVVDIWGIWNRTRFFRDSLEYDAFPDEEYDEGIPDNLLEVLR